MVPPSLTIAVAAKLWLAERTASRTRERIDNFMVAKRKALDGILSHVESGFFAESSLAYLDAGGSVFVEYGHAAACGDTAAFSPRDRWPAVRPKRAYSAGSTASVSRVALIRP